MTISCSVCGGNLDSAFWCKTCGQPRSKRTLPVIVPPITLRPDMPTDNPDAVDVVRESRRAGEVEALAREIFVRAVAARIDRYGDSTCYSEVRDASYAAARVFLEPRA